MSQTNLKPQITVTHLSTTVTTTTELIATPSIMAVWELAKETKLQIEAQKAAYEVLCDELRKYMGDDKVLLSPTGAKIATYNWIKGAVTINRKALETHFNDVFEVVKKVGDATRRLELK